MLAAIAAAALACVLAAPFFGLEPISWQSAWSAESGVKHEIFWRIRLPRVAAAFLAGAAFAVSGMVFQALFRNPLATPFTLGVSSGAAFGAALYIKVGILFSVAGVSGAAFSSFMGALLSIGLVYGLTRARSGFSASTMLLAGVAVNFFFSSFILFVQYLSDFAESFRIVRWLMGGFEVVGFEPVRSILPFVAVGAAIVFFSLDELNLLTLGEDLATSKGVDVERTKRMLFLASSLMVGGVVSLTGPIGFVGMMSPHICRLLLGGNHNHLAPASFLFGGAFLCLCDTFARTLIAPAEIPVGIVTSLLGGPFFLWLLLGPSRRKSLSL